MEIPDYFHYFLFSDSIISRKIFSKSIMIWLFTSKNTHIDKNLFFSLTIFGFFFSISIDYALDTLQIETLKLSRPTILFEPSPHIIASLSCPTTTTLHTITNCSKVKLHSNFSETQVQYSCSTVHTFENLLKKSTKIYFFLLFMPVVAARYF
jgi:hypothetical protein